MKEQIQYSHDNLVVLIKQRDQKAFTYLYDNYAQSLYSVINSLLRDVEESEDVLQKTFLKIWENFDSFDASKGRLYTWMLNLSRNMAIDYKRSKINNNKNNTISQNNSHLVTIPVTEDKTDTIGLKKVVENLKTEYEILIELAYYQGYTQEEISIKLNIPLGTVKTRIRKAILILREQLQEKNHLQ